MRSLTPCAGQVYGIDGCRSGWVIAKREDAGIGFEILNDLKPVFSQITPDCTIAIDIPIGVPEDSPRICDAEARVFLGWPRSSSIFSPPVRSALSATTFQDALNVNRKVAGIGISKQAFFIMSKIREVDELMSPSGQRCLKEVHPEVTFASLAGVPMRFSKKSKTGRAERLAVLRHNGIALSEERLIAERQRLGMAGVAVDDLIDAAACLVTALHIRAGRSRSLGFPAQTDRKGLRMEIVTCSAQPKCAVVR